jgi:hypothetical protein
MKNFILGLMITVCSMSYSYGGECNGSCYAARLPRRIVTLSTEVVNVPVEVTTRTVSRVRKIVRKAPCDCCTTTKSSTVSAK